MPTARIRWLDPNPPLPESRTLTLSINCPDRITVTETHRVVDLHSGTFELRDGCELVGYLSEPGGATSPGSDPTLLPEPATWLGTLACLITLAFVARHRRRKRHATERVCLTCRRVTPGTWCPYCPGDWND